MSELHLAYLNLGSNIQPGINLVRALQLLTRYGKIQSTSSVWESESVGADGPNYLNVCVLFESPHSREGLKDQVINPVETQLGRKRGENKYAPRTIDIDIVLFDDKPVIRDDLWKMAFIIVPLAEIYPEYQNPDTGERVSETATRLRREVWLETRRGILG